MTLTEATNLLNNTYGEHLDKIYIPSLQRNILFKPLTTAHVKLLARNQFIDDFQLPVEILKLSLFDKLCTEDLSSENISSKTITLFDYLAFLIGLRQMFGQELTFKFTCNCNPDKQFEEKLVLDELFDDIISEYKPQNEIFECVDDKTNIIWKFELTNFTMIDYLYYKHIIFKLKEQDKDSLEVINAEKFLRPLLYIKNIYMNDEKIDNWDTLILTEKLKFFNNISPKVTILGDKDNLTAFLKNTFYEEKLLKFIENLSITCPECHKEYRGVYDIDNFFTF